jgi:P-type Ca2+ transporter type 2C
VVLYVPPMQRAFGTVALSLGDWLFCIAVASSVLWLTEARKMVARAMRHGANAARVPPVRGS